VAESLSIPPRRLFFQSPASTLGWVPASGAMMFDFKDFRFGFHTPIMNPNVEAGDCFFSLAVALKIAVAWRQSQSRPNPE
jgi:hypothetical protein